MRNIGHLTDGNCPISWADLNLLSVRTQGLAKLLTSSIHGGYMTDPGQEDRNTRLIGGQLNNPLSAETLEGLRQLAAWDQMSYSGPPEDAATQPGISPEPEIRYEAPPENATAEQLHEWGLRALAARDQMSAYQPGNAITDEESNSE